MSQAPPTPSPVRFEPPPGLAGRHVQTIGSHLARPNPILPTVRERIETEDGDFLDLDRLECVATPPKGPRGKGTVIVLHGLEGSSDRAYVRILMAHLRSAGLRSVGLNFRGCSGEPNRLERSYHSGETEDLATVVDHVRRSHGDPVAAVGFSLGGNVLLKYLGERGADSRLAAAAAVSVPFDLRVAARTLASGLWGRLYTRYFLRKLRAKIAAKRHLLPRSIIVAGQRARTLEQFDDAVTAPVHGFDGASDYYARSSAARFIDGVRTPTLLIHAFDDPFLPRKAVPLDRMRRNPHLELALPERGGHLGFFQRRRRAENAQMPMPQGLCNELEASSKMPVLMRFWAEGEAARFIQGRMTSLLAG